MTYEIKIVDVSTGEETVRNATAAESKIIEADKIASQNAKIELEAKIAAKNAVLTKLGLSTEEISALLS